MGATLIGRLRGKPTAEPCPSCDFGEIMLFTDRTQELFGQVLKLPDLRKCDSCAWAKEDRL